MSISRSFCLVLIALAACAGGVLPAAAQSVPMGSYLQSCQDVREVAGWLKATCRDNSGRWVESTTAIAWCTSGEIVNDNGKLACRPRAGGSSFSGDRPPMGTYMGTCRDIKLWGGWLKATCQDGAGRWVESSISPGWCTGRDIANANGQLACR
ncbi:MAG: CVNH domain-containing protein [Pseudomonadota bacterium]